MPELPDITIYLEALAPRIVGQPLERARIVSPSLLRTVDPPLAAAEGRKVVALRRIGKRIVWEMEGQLFLVFHLMIAGRFKWRPAGTSAPAKVGLASFDFPSGTLLLTEASPKKRASLHVVNGEAGLAAHNPGGLDVIAADLATFKTRLQSESHTLKRALTDPHLFDGIGNWLSDEILHAAKLSPFQLTGILRDMPDRRPCARRSISLSIAQGRLAPIARRVGGQAGAMTIRRARDTDAVTVGRIHVESWNVAYRGIMPDDVIARTDLAYRTAFWQERIADREWPVFLMEENGKPVAFCQMIPTRDADDDPKRVEIGRA